MHNETIVHGTAFTTAINIGSAFFKNISVCVSEGTPHQNSTSCGACCPIVNFKFTLCFIIHCPIQY